MTIVLYRCLTEHPYTVFPDNGGCGHEWKAQEGPVECARCGNIYIRNVTRAEEAEREKAA